MVELGLESCLAKAKSLNIDTLAKFAFGCDYTPQHPKTELLEEKLLGPIAGDKKENIPMLRMLWWEAWSATAADMKRRQEGATGAKRKLGMPELSTRRKATLAKVPGLTITEELDVGDEVIQDCVNILESDKLAYIPWELCTKKTFEVLGIKRDPEWIKDAQGYMRAETCEERGTTRVDCFFALDLLLQRRGLAMDMADLMSWSVHEMLRQDLMRAARRSPPEGYSNVTLAQLRRADEEVFRLMARNTQDGLKKLAEPRRGDGESATGPFLPLDKPLVEAIRHRDYDLCLQPLPGASAQRGIKRGPEEPAPSHPSGLTRKEQQMENTIKQLREANAALKAQRVGKGGSAKGGRVKGKGKDKDKGAGSASLPWELRKPGVSGVTQNNEAICYGFQFGTCKEATPGGRCRRGRHVCAKLACGGTHGYLEQHSQD